MDEFIHDRPIAPHFDAGLMTIGLESFDGSFARGSSQRDGAAAPHRLEQRWRDGSTADAGELAFLSDLPLRLPIMSVQESVLGPYPDDICWAF